MDRPRLIRSGTIDLAEHPAFRIGRLLVDPLAREIRFNDKSQRVEPQPLKVLVALAERRGEVVTREELISCCWDGRAIGDDVINRAILLLRRIAKASGAFVIETIPKAGYRLAENSVVRSYSRSIVGAVLAVAAIAGSALLLLRERSDQSHPPLAVIELAPFAAIGGGVATETARASEATVADMLANSGLPVVRPHAMSQEGKPAELRLSGQVRDAGDQIEADVHLDDLVHGTLLLSHRFLVERDQAKNLPEQMGAFAATSLGNAGAMMALDRRRPEDPHLTGELLRQWTMMINTEDPIGTYRTVDRIADQMPNSAVAQLGLAMVSSHVIPLLPMQERFAALAKARRAAARAHVLAPQDGDVAWPDCQLYSPVRLIECENSLTKSFNLDPNSLFVAAGMRNHLVDVGRFRDALEYDRLAVAAMPYMAGRLAASTMLLEGLGFHDRADEQFSRARRWWPNNELLFSTRFQGMLDRGDVARAAAFAARIPPQMGLIDKQAAAIVAAEVKARRPDQVRSHCLSSTLDDNLTHLCLVALVELGDDDGAMWMVDRLYPNLIASNPKDEDRLYLARRGGLSLGILSTPALAPLRNDRRFISVAGRVGLLRYWRQDHLPDFCTLGHERICALIQRDRSWAA